MKKKKKQAPPVDAARISSEAPAACFDGEGQSRIYGEDETFAKADEIKELGVTVGARGLTVPGGVTSTEVDTEPLPEHNAAKHLKEKDAHDKIELRRWWTISARISLQL